MKETSIYVSLDTLFDTRLGAISLIQELTPGLVKQHLQRRRDHWAINMDQFDNLYRCRDREVLRRSAISNIIYHINTALASIMLMNSQTPTGREAKLYINFHPYDLTVEERRVIIAGVASRLNYPLPIEELHYKPSDLTPGWVGTHLNFMFEYHYYEWLLNDAVTEALPKVGCHNTSLLIPDLVFRGAKTMDPSLKRLLKLKKVSVQQFMTTELAPMINLQFLPPEAFSINLAGVGQSAS